MKVGDKIYIEDNNGGILEWEILRIGKKYLYIHSDNRHPISKDELKYECENYPQYNKQYYANKQEILDKQEIRQLSSKIREAMDRRSIMPLTLDQLRAIHKIITN